MEASKKKRAFCFDLDGTVTKQEILPLIAKEVNIFEEIDTLTKVTMQGLIPFKNSFRLRVKLLSDVPIPVVQNIVDKVEIQEGLLEFINRNKEHCYIVTGNIDIWVEKLKQKIHCKFFSSEGEYDGSKLIGLKTILDKADAVASLRSQYDEIVAIGDGMNDASMFEISDIRIACGAVHNPVETLIKMSDYVSYDEKGLLNVLNSLANGSK